MKRKLWLIASALVVAAAGIYVLWKRAAPPEAVPVAEVAADRGASSSPPGGSNVPPERAMGDRPAASAPIDNRRSAATSLPTVTLPPEGTSVVRLLAELRTAAEAGDARAGCRLGIELVECRDARDIERQAGNLQETSARSQDPDARTRVDAEASALRTENASRLARCEGVADGDLDEAWRFLWRAAQGGSVAAASKFARYPGLSYNDVAAAAEGWDLYRQNASRLLWQAVQGGDTMALFQSWFSAMSGLSAGGKGVIARDPYAALVYGNAALPLLDPRRRAMVDRVDARLVGELRPDQVLQASQEGLALRERYFAGATSALATENDGYQSVADCAR